MLIAPTMTAPTAAPAPAVPPSDLTAQLGAVYNDALVAWRRTGQYDHPAKQAANRALEGAQLLLPSTDGVIHERLQTGIDELQRGLDTWGVTAKEPYRKARAAFLHALEYSQGYHRS